MTAPTLAFGTWLAFCVAFLTGTGLAAVQPLPLPAYEREDFAYSSLGRDPFQPLDIETREGPRFADLRLSGVLLSSEVGSVAMLTDRSTGRRYRAREGDVLGDAAVERIHADGVAFVITDFGVRRRETLRVRREGGGEE